jgi:hypothetical protein
MAAPTTQITATIGRVNDNGLQTEEQPGVWLNISKYANPQPVIPPRGTPVRITLDGAGFVRAIEPLDASTNGHQSAQEGPSAPPDRETVITRLACLKAASAFLSTRPDAKSGDVLAVAASWEAWIRR